MLSGHNEMLPGTNICTTSKTAPVPLYQLFDAHTFYIKHWVTQYVLFGDNWFAAIQEKKIESFAQIIDREHDWFWWK